MLSERELTSARADAVSTLPDTATRLVKTQVDDGQGGRTTTYVGDASAFIPCKIEPNGRDPREDIVGGATRGANRWVALVPAETAIAAGDRLSCAGRIYHVLGAYVGGQTEEILGRLDLELVEGA